ncbi:Nitroreductase [Hexamita inflata]|uniref:Nitroreductase n=1 Tax=Hexamita inflata TaxID=28002 RepID=A0AA86NBW6_9EUKA|nr:Nitroreductase [Hexamita inflata]
MNFKVSSDCVQCEQCVQNCLCGSLKLVDSEIKFDSTACIKCGQCFAICPTGAISMYDCDSSSETYSSDPLLKAIQERRSVRSFKQEVISESKITELMQVIKYAPSGTNQRNAEYVVLGRPIMEKLSPIMAQVLIHTYPHMKAMLEHSKDALFRGAPHVVIAIQKGPIQDDGIIALSEFELLAQQNNIGTFWCGFLKYTAAVPAIREILQLKEGENIAAALGFGFADVQFARPAARQPVKVRFM